MNKELGTKNLTKYFRKIWNFLYSYNALIVALGLAIFAGIIFTFVNKGPDYSIEQSLENQAGVVGEFNPSPILNPHSHPKAGDQWIVSFNTPEGTADLAIIPNDQVTIDDLDFVSLKCGDEKKSPQILGNDVIFYPNWSCEEVAKVSHLVNVAGKHTLRLEFGDKIAYAYNSPNTETLRPNAVGDNTNWLPWPGTGEANWQDVDEVTQDDVTTEVYTGSATYVSDDYALQDTAIPAGSTINSVKVYYCIRHNGSPWYKPYLRLNSTDQDGTAYNATLNNLSYETRSEIISRPGGGSWAVSDLNSLKVGIRGNKGTGTWADCTQSYVEVDYTPAPSWQPRPPAINPSGGGFLIF